MKIRRLVTALDARGQSIVAADGAPPWSKEFEHTPGFASNLVWFTPARPAVPFDGLDPTTSVTSLIPAPGETRFLIVTFPPDSVMADPRFDPVAAAKEQAEQSPGLVEAFERDHPWHMFLPEVKTP
jgi:hypothetical protein